MEMLGARWDAARRYLERAHEVDPQTTRYLERLGLLCLAEGRPREALAWFERQRRATPRLEDVEARLGQAYLALGDTARARSQFERELARHPNNRIARALLATPPAR
jgi:tetratricopeptide (TPR) repeat protein